MPPVDSKEEWTVEGMKAGGNSDGRRDDAMDLSRLASRLLVFSGSELGTQGAAAAYWGSGIGVEVEVESHAPPASPSSSPTKRKPPPDRSRSSPPRRRLSVIVPTKRKIPNSPSLGLSDAMAASSSSAGSGGKAQRRDTPSCILLNMEGYIADCSNATTAWSKTSTGVPISVSFCIARPPVLSHFFVHCPGLDLAALPSLPPKAICSDADLVVLRVPLDPDARSSQWHSDYFVYRMHPRRPKLDLLPNPRPARFADNDIAVLSSGGSGYVVAALKVLPSFELHLYRSAAGTRRWTSQKLSLEEPLRSTVCPVPDSAENKMFHTTAKTIAIGGKNGTVGWVDLWRGILLCDVHSAERPPKLRDIPLPLPARGNWEDWETIKYVEMEITLPEHVPVFPSRPEPASFVEWVNWQRQEECEQPLSYTLVPGSWTATTYSLPIPVGSWEDWRRESLLPDEDARHYELMQKLISSRRRVP
ncbi:hypothetical protein HU200_024185 [Digitaria exilis]|uniref:DUF1618 domain-containing protein n=1 Tax=Digitaria exilis TaxID=1010633 RepID=A0A835EY36_9POAL|nr:hypothetical protein HU200_024185 [Digitaria exilis]